MSIDTASSKINRWAAQAESLGFRVELVDTSDLAAEWRDEVMVQFVGRWATYTILATRYVGDGNRAKAFRHTIRRVNTAGNYTGTAMALQTREIGYWIALDGSEN